MKILILSCLLVAVLAYVSGNSVLWGLAPVMGAVILLLLLIVMALAQFRRQK
ncbi:hypothetical protein [Chromobacterium sphagni]|uniref:hypothetical protein n=1 Tax=Chromobacterium sphagni TaxID=1903179 RepID=UPI0019D3A737|nr:hypothetical protein [Chromobacterium sphagni]